MTDHTARPGSWETLTQWAATKTDSLADCLMELRARVEQLEQAQQQPAPSTPAGQGELVSSVAEAMRLATFSGPYEPEQAAILAVADWLDARGDRGSADALRREVGR